MSKRYRVTWDNVGPYGMFPLSAEFTGPTETLDCLRSMSANTKNVEFDEDIAYMMLAALANGEASEYTGEGFVVRVITEETP